MKVARKHKTNNSKLKKLVKTAVIIRLIYWKVWAINGHGRRIYLGIMDGKTSNEAVEKKLKEFTVFPRFQKDLDEKKIIITVERV